MPPELTRHCCCLCNPEMQQNFGPIIHDDGTVTFRAWAPSCPSLKLCVTSGEIHSMESLEDGFHSVRVPWEPGSTYWFELPNGDRRPDPASRFQPEGVHGPSELVGPRSFASSTGDWKGVSKKDLIIYELHVGAFSRDGSYRGVIGRLDELAELGITAIELMPLSQAAGRWNWGYDGVNLFAPNHNYGRPEDLSRLIDEAHARGIAVILDVVYNHFGPEGNYLHPFGGYISRRHKTPWGDSPNLDGKDSGPMRKFVLENVRYWLEDFCFDGLRLDATHCIADDSQTHITREIGTLVKELRTRLNREIHLIAESNVYDPELLTPLEEGGYGFDGLWCDDFVHSVSAILQPDVHLSSRQYRPGSDLELVLDRGYVFQGTFREEHRRHEREDYPGRVALESLVSAIQHHDFIGNHPRGHRLHHIIPPEAHRAAAALLLLHPSIPMLFMGEEFASESPFLFFVDFGDDHLRNAVEKGRKREHPQHDWKGVVSPLSPEAFLNSRIETAATGTSETLEWYKSLIRFRKVLQENDLLSATNLEFGFSKEKQIICLRYQAGDGKAYVLIRLHANDPSPPMVEVSVDGTACLQQNCSGSSHGAGRYLLAPYAVLAGIGEVGF